MNADGTLLYSSYPGGSETDIARGVETDSTGAVYVSGDTRSADFPIKNAAQPTIKSSADLYDRIDVFAAKLNPSLSGNSALIFSTFMGGTLIEHGNNIGVHSDGTVYVTGRTFSPDFPTTPGSFQAVYSGDGTDAFVFKLSSDGSSVIYSTYIGGSVPVPYASTGSEELYALSVRADGSVALCGRTTSSDYPLKNAFRTFFGPVDILDGVLTVLNGSGSDLIFSTLVGGSRGDFLTDITEAPDGNLWVTGVTGSDDFPILDEFQGDPADLDGINDVVLSKVSPTGQLLFSTYLGGAMNRKGEARGSESGHGVATDPSGAVHLVGAVGSSDFPTVNALYPDPIGTLSVGDVFVAKIANEAAPPPPPPPVSEQSIPLLSNLGILLMAFLLALAGYFFLISPRA